MLGGDNFYFPKKVEHEICANFGIFTEIQPLIVSLPFRFPEQKSGGRGGK